jgi:SAM-dependent methyltransferase
MKHDPRNLEWQRRYEEKDTPWDKGAPSPALVDFLREGRIAGRVLVPGCGFGHEARALAAQPNVSVVGLDLSAAAVARAKALTPEDETNVSFIAGDFFRLPKKLKRSFAWLVEHTCFCAIDPRHRADYAAAAASALRTGGILFGIFYLDPGSDTAPPFPVTRDELTTFFEPHFTLLEEWVPKNSFPGREQRELVRLLEKRSG